jgi:hypothetical protein
MLRLFLIAALALPARAYPVSKWATGGECYFRRDADGHCWQDVTPIRYWLIEPDWAEIGGETGRFYRARLVTEAEWRDADVPVRPDAPDDGEGEP